MNTAHTVVLKISLIPRGDGVDWRLEVANCQQVDADSVRESVYLDERIGSRAEPRGNLTCRGWIAEE